MKRKNWEIKVFEKQKNNVIEKKESHFVSNATESEVREQAKDIEKKYGITCSILVVEQ